MGRCETGDKRRGSNRRWERERLSLLSSPPLLAFPRLSSILRETVRAAGAYSGICSEIYVRMERSRVVPRAASILLPPIYNFSAHLRQLSDARERAPALQPGDSILRRVVYYRRDRKNCRLRVDLLPGKSHAVAVAVAVAVVEGQGATRGDGNI